MKVKKIKIVLLFYGVSGRLFFLNILSLIIEDKLLLYFKLKEEKKAVDDCC